MDDELPLFIFVISQMKSEFEPEFEIQLLDDYFKLNDNCDFEEKYFRNFSVGLSDGSRFHSEGMGC